MKRIMLALLALMLLAFSFSASAVESKTFSDVEVNGVTYYDLLDGKQSDASSGTLNFYQQYLTTSRSAGNKIDPSDPKRSAHDSLLSLWQDVYAGLRDDSDNQARVLSGYYSDYSSIQSKIGDYKLETKAGWVTGGPAAKTELINFYKNTLGKSATSGFDNLDLSGISGNVYYYCGGYRYTGGEGDATEGAMYAILFSNFRVYQVISGKYIEGNIETLPDNELDATDTSNVYSVGFTNQTADDANASGSLKTTFTESVTLTSGSSYTHSNTHAIATNAKISIGKPTTLFGGEIGASYTYSWSDATGQNYSEGKTHTNSQEISSTISMTLPAHTQAVMLEKVGTATMDMTFPFPVAVIYDVDIIFYDPINDDNPYVHVSYKENDNDNSYDARSDLYQRAVKGANDSNGLKYSGAALSSAQTMWVNVPLTTVDTTLDYVCQFTSNSLSSIKPLYDLKTLELKNATDKSFSLPEGGTLEMDEIDVTGLDTGNVPYYGFSQDKGKWALLDSNGSPVTGNANDYAELAVDPITKREVLTIKKGGGTVYLRYEINEDAYELVNQNLDDPAAAKEYVKNADLTNRAVITIHTLAGVSGYTVTASGEIVACVGDEAIDLNGDDSPVSCMVLDATGKQISAGGVKWEAKELSGITIDESNKLSFQKVGAYHIRPVWSGLYPSQWLTVTVRAERKLTAMELSDPDGILAGASLDDTGAGTITVNLKELALRYIDQYDEEMTAPDTLDWYVSKDGASRQKIDDPAAYTISEAGTYAFCAQSGTVRSNELSMTARAGATLTAMELSDPNGILADARLSGSGEGVTINLTDLAVRYIDQYGQDMAAVPESPDWYVTRDGSTQLEKINNASAYTIKEAGTYTFYADKDGVRSNGLTMTVYPAAELSKIIIADDPDSPILADYILGSGSNRFDLTGLSISAFDDLGNPYTLEEGNLTWQVNGSPVSGGILTVTRDGTYQISCYYQESGAAKVTSNTLVLTVLPTKTITRLVIADDPLTPILKDYLIGSGSDSFDLSQLTVTGYDQYDNPVDADAITWYVNGAALSGSTLTVSKVGSYEIYAAYQAGSLMVKSNSLTLKVITRVTGIQLNAYDVKLAAGDTFELVATAIPAEETDRYTFSSSKPEVASVDSAGKIKALVQGETTVTVRSASGLEAQCVVTVVAAPESVTISPNEMLLGLGDSYLLTPILSPAWSTASLSYSSSDESVATVDETGRVTARALGEAVISVATHNGRRANCYVKVVKRPDALEAPEELVLGLRETVDLDAQVAVKTAKAKVLTILTYESKDPSVASVSDEGVVTARKEGECTIVITSYNGLNHLVKVKVMKAPGKVTLSNKKLSLEYGEKASLTYTLPEGTAGKVTFRSSKPGYVRVSSTGEITAIKKGTAVITATTYNGKKASCKVTVTGKNPLTLKVGGKIDVLRPSTYAIIKPSITSGYTDFKVTITAAKGKTDYGDVTDWFEITQQSSGALEIRKKADVTVKSATYTATVSMKWNGRSLTASKSFKVYKGSATGVLSQKTVTLSSETPSAEVQVTMKDSSLSAISKITATSKRFSFSYLGDGKVRVSLIGDQVPKNSETITLKIYLKSHETGYADTLKLKIKVAQ